MMNIKIVNTTTLLLNAFSFLIMGIVIPGFAQDQAENEPMVTVSGNNQINGSYGTIMYDSHKPVEGAGDYLTDYLDFNIGIKDFFIRGTFLVNSPGVGFNPNPETFSEYFHRRTLGFKSNYLTVEAGNFMTTFGKGLTLNLRENRKTEKNYVLDGISLSFDHSLFTLKSVAGRSTEKKFKRFALVNAKNDLDSVTALLEDVNYRDNVMGAYAESYYPFATHPLFSLLSASSVGGGVVYYGNDVKAPMSKKIIDTASGDTTLKVINYQDRNKVVLPFWSLNLSMGKLSISYENALMYYDRYQFVDTVNAEKRIKNYNAYSGYLSMGIDLGSFYVSGEYKNYFYALNWNPSPQVIGTWVEAPDARQKHGWHLLTKHSLNKLMDDDLGYNTTITWSHGKTTLKTNFNTGGSHVKTKDSTGFSMLKFSDKKRYMESYTQWEQNFTSTFNSLIGVDIGILDPQEPKLFTKTALFKLSFGPFAEKHSFELIIEAQNTTKDFELKSGDTVKNTIRQGVFNAFVQPTYSLSPYLSVFLAVEREPGLFFDYAEALKGKKPKTHNYVSGGITITPVQNHVLSIEAGYMSGRMECNPPPCVYIQPFKGIKMTLNSVF